VRGSERKRGAAKGKKKRETRQLEATNREKPRERSWREAKLLHLL